MSMDLKDDILEAAIKNNSKDETRTYRLANMNESSINSLYRTIEEYENIKHERVVRVHNETGGGTLDIGSITPIMEKKTFIEAFEKYVLDNDEFYEQFKFKKLVKWIIKKRVRN